MSLFDSLQNHTHDVVLRTMGDDATWQPSAVGSTLMAAKVLFNRPTELQYVEHAQYNPYEYSMEYKEGDFIGLVEAVREGRNEVVTILGIEYIVQDVPALWDGKTYKAKLQLSD